MKKLQLRIVTILLIISGVLAGCGSSQPEDTVSLMLATDSAEMKQTVSALQSAVQVLSTQVSEQSSATIPTAAVTQTRALSPTVPPLQTQTSQSAGTSPSPTTMIDTGDHADYVNDLIPDGTRYGPGTPFTETWTLVNTGETTWTNDYAAVFVAGNPLGSTTRVPIPYSISPNMTVDITVQMTAPPEYGKYRSEWLLENGKGQKFGLGADQIAFWVDIEVADVPTTTEIPGYIQDASITHVIVTDESCNNYTFEMSGHIIAFQDYGFYDKNVSYRWRVIGPSETKRIDLSDQFIKDNNLYIGPDEVKFSAVEGQEYKIWLDVLRPSEMTVGPWTHIVTACNY